MPRLPVHTVESAPPHARPILQLARNRRGEITNVIAGLAASPAALAVLVGMEAALDSYATFDRKTREAISLAVSSADKCSYGEVAHTAAALAAGWSSDEVLLIKQGEPGLSPAMDALLVVVRELVADRGVIAQASWQSARAAGWNDAELAELFAHAMFVLFTDYFAHYAESEPPVMPRAVEPSHDAVTSDAPRERRRWMRAWRPSTPGWTGR